MTTIVKKEAFIKNYLLNKLKHSDKNSTFLNFSDIEYDLRPYIEANYNEYIKVCYLPINDAAYSRDTVKKLNMLHRDYVNKYVWLKRQELLDLLNKECAELNKSYKLSNAKKQFLIDNYFTDKEISKINSVYKEWYIFRLFRGSKVDVVNRNRFTVMYDIIGKNIAHIVLSTDNFSATFNFNPTKKKENGKYYLSGRMTNVLTSTKNDLEEKKRYWWSKEPEADGRMLRSEFLKYYNEWLDLGDMSSNYPNILNCIKTEIYLDTDFHSKIAAEFNISRDIAKMAAVRCCFNCKKSDILYGLLDDADFNKIEKEIDMINSSGCMRVEDGKIKINRGYKINNCHNWFTEHSNNEQGEINEFFKYCADFLTSWDACHIVYKNDLCPSDLSVFSSAVESCVILDALKHGVIILNAYDHGYSINGKYYDWKAAYKKYAEMLAPIFNEAKEKDKKGIVGNGKYVLCSITKTNNKNAVKAEVRKFLIEKMSEYNDLGYVLNEATKLYKWSAPLKCYWKKWLKGEYNYDRKRNVQ